MSSIIKYKKFTKIIKESMKKNAKGVRALARECGIDASYLSKVLKGKRNPPADEEILKKLAGILDLDPVMLIIYTGRIPAHLQSLFESAGFLDKIMADSELKQEPRPTPYKHFTASVPEVSRNTPVSRKPVSSCCVALDDELL